MERLSKEKLIEVTESDVHTLWKQNHTPVSLYIHSPFCKTVCNFCAYRGITPKKGDIDSYYENILPRQIYSYENVISSNQVSSCFFGGGTPSIAPLKHLRNIFNVIPNFQTIKEKFFELHPVFTSLELIDILAENNFNNIIIGVQSFDYQTLAKTNRPYCVEDRIRLLIEEIHKHGMFVWLDIVGFINYAKEDLAIFIDDIRKAVSLQPDEISICPNFYYKHNVIDMAVKSLYKCINEVSDYHLYKVELSYEAIKTMYEKKKAIRIVLDNSRVEDFMRYIEINDNPDNLKQSILGIGSFENENRDTFSMLKVQDKLIRYVERTESSKIKYYIVR